MHGALVVHSRHSRSSIVGAAAKQGLTIYLPGLKLGLQVGTTVAAILAKCIMPHKPCKQLPDLLSWAKL